MSDADVATVRARLERLRRDSPFARFLALELTDLDLSAQRLTVRLPFRAEFARAVGSAQWHGGPIAALIDTAGALAVGMSLDAPAGTVDFRTDYLRVAQAPYLTAIAIVRRLGRTLSVADVEISNPNSELVATGRGTFYAESVR